MTAAQEKMEHLKKYLKELGSVAVAFSSGVDSTFLLKTARDVLGDKVIAVTAQSCSFPQRELNEAKAFCEKEGIRHMICQSEELEIEGFSKNPPNRCYLCKHELFEKIIKLAKENGIEYVAEGSNMDDNGDYRPGLIAVKELNVKSPLREAKLTKAEIRAYARELGISVAERPSSPCLATRLPYGTEIDMALLKRIGEGEEALRNLGLKNVRIRVHGEIARLEVDSASFPAILEQREEVLSILKKVGVPYLTLDLEGFRSGSMDIHVK